MFILDDSRVHEEGMRQARLRRNNDTHRKANQRHRRTKYIIILNIWLYIMIRKSGYVGATSIEGCPTNYLFWLRQEAFSLGAASQI